LPTFEMNVDSMGLIIEYAMRRESSV